MRDIDRQFYLVTARRAVVKLDKLKDEYKADENEMNRLNEQLCTIAQYLGFLHKQHLLDYLQLI